MLNKKNVIDTDLVIDEIDNNSSNDWNELCEECSSLMSKANLSNDDIDRIVEEVKRSLVD